MKLVKYLVPLWIGVLLYTFLSACFGAKGLSAYKQLEIELERETANLNVLSVINRDLTDTRDILLNDKKNYSVYARELGFAARGESFVRIIGLGSSPKTVVSPGQVVSPLSPDFIQEHALQIFSFFIAFTLFVSMVSYDFLKYMKSQESGFRNYRGRPSWNKTFL